MQRRELIVSAAFGAMLATGCASDPQVSAQPRGPLTPWRVVTGGFLTPPTVPGAPGMPPRPGAGMYIKLMAPMAIALRGPDLLVADSGTSRLWRIDPGFNHASGIAGAPAGLGTALALGPDQSAWVLDAGARQVLRFARDGRLLQSHRLPTELPSPVGIALADGGATLLVADGMGAQWAEQRGPAGLARLVAPQSAANTTTMSARISGVDAITLAGDDVIVLDRLAAAVHRVARDGRVLATLGRGELVQPSALAADRDGRIFVVDAAARTLVVLRDGVPARRFDAAELGVQRIGGIAVDERVLALSDTLLGQVSLFLIAPGAWS
jgi:hypothetical protein